jgi:large subunit ribosomal protein L20|uniref:Large ribosomal subunit protein bL20c n=1 Tax=Drosera rotundifolia TaxID=173423 RepID=A0A140E9Y5_DRORT|nr:ribosomal protein L20 [Drosera rotundifolia]AMK97348.1 ribosomal protein L20 [Drosera rotundifolia]
MSRVRRGNIARRRRTKMRSVASNFRKAARLSRSMAQQKKRSLFSAHRDRNMQKRNFRRLWITRINAVIREKYLYYNYSKYIHELYNNQLILNRKILAQVTILNRNCFFKLFNKIIKTWKNCPQMI